MMQWIWCANTKKSWIMRYRENIRQRIHVRERIKNIYRRRQNLSQTMILRQTKFWLSLWSSFFFLFYQLRLCIDSRRKFSFHFRRKFSFRVGDFRNCCCHFFENNELNEFIDVNVSFFSSRWANCYNYYDYDC